MSLLQKGMILKERVENFRLTSKITVGKKKMNEKFIIPLNFIKVTD